MNMRTVWRNPSGRAVMGSRLCRKRQRGSIMADPIHLREFFRIPFPHTLSATVRSLLDRLPTDCALCLARSQGGRPCEGCLSDLLQGLPDRRCPVCALGLPPNTACPDCALLQPAFARVISALEYKPPVDQLILQFKNAGRFQHARFMAEILASAVRLEVPELLDEITIVLPVPSGRLALRRRGFNPAAEIARQLAGRLCLRYWPIVAHRRHDGISQKTLNRHARAKFQANRYACRHRLSGETVAVVDDVLTTGATLHAVANELMQAGAKSVVGLVVARTPYQRKN